MMILYGLLLHVCEIDLFFTKKSFVEKMSCYVFARFDIFEEK